MEVERARNRWTELKGRGRPMRTRCWVNSLATSGLGIGASSPEEFPEDRENLAVSVGVISSIPPSSASPFLVSCLSSSSYFVIFCFPLLDWTSLENWGSVISLWWKLCLFFWFSQELKLELETSFWVWWDFCFSSNSMSTTNVMRDCSRLNVCSEPCVIIYIEPLTLAAYVSHLHLNSQENVMLMCFRRNKSIHSMN